MFRAMALLVLFSMSVSHSYGATFSGNSSGLFDAGAGFVNPLEWGDPSSRRGDPSSLTYNGANPFTSNESDAFMLGVITYNNTAIKTGSGIASAQFKVGVEFSNPALGAFDFLHDLAIDNADGNAFDTVVLSPVTGLNSFLTELDGVNYYFELLGFMLDGVISERFTQAEGANTGAAVYARISTVNPVSEPATLWLMLSAFGSLMWLNRRKNAYI
ncbi:MAG: choice-of-anchor K domain-containing protein [Methyloprofundus sp.]|nr:choice-of-anchor K domain-containing protein [Methyloprofundus sp.]